MKKTVKNLVGEVLIDKCFTDGTGSYFYVGALDDDGTAYCLSLDYGEIRANQEVGFDEISDLELITKDEFLDALVDFIKETIKYK